MPHFRLTCVAQKRLCLSSLMGDSYGISTKRTMGKERGGKKETRLPALALPSFYILKICWKLKKITPTRTFLEEALRTFAWEATKEATLDDQNLVCYTAFFSVVTQHSSPQVSGGEHCVTTLKTAV